MKSGLYRYVFIIGCLWAHSASAHDGHRFVVTVKDGKLVAQGVNTERPVRFNEKAIRPYPNVIHHNWTNYGFNGVDTAIATLPGFEVQASEQALWNASLALRVMRICRWRLPPVTPDASTVPVFVEPVDANLQIIHGLDKAGTSTGLPAVIRLARNIPKSGASDLDPRYELRQRAGDSIDVIEAVLTTSANGIEDSDMIYIIQGPPGYRYHRTLLFLERYLSQNQPTVVRQPLVKDIDPLTGLNKYLPVILIASVLASFAGWRLLRSKQND